MRARVSMPLKSPASTGVKSLNFKALPILKKNQPFLRHYKNRSYKKNFFVKFILK